MIAEAELVVGTPVPGQGRSPRIERMMQCAPVSWRPTPYGVYLVGSSASPVGDDQVKVNIRVKAGARLTIRSSAAAVVWSGWDTRQSINVDVGAGAELDWAPEPTIATAGCNHTQRSMVRLGPGARLRWREILVIGRHGERCGPLRSRLSVDTDAGPLLRHELALGQADTGWAGPAVVGEAKAVGLLLLAGEDVPGGSAAGPGWAVMDLEGSGVLVVAAGNDVSEVAAALDGAFASR